MSTLEKIKAELHATAEMHEDGDYYLRDKWVDEIIDKYAEKEPTDEWQNGYDMAWEEAKVFYEQEPCEDVIDRAEAMTEIMMFAGNVKSDEEDVYIKVSDAVQLLRELPSVTQEPVECEDTVSRQAVFDLLEDTNNGLIINEVSQLPSVRPQEQTGHWIMNRQLERRTCDNCHAEYRWSFYPHNYCPNCGARMVEPTCDTCEYNTAAFMPCNACDNKSLFKPQERSDKE